MRETLKRRAPEFIGAILVLAAGIIPLSLDFGPALSLKRFSFDWSYDLFASQNAMAAGSNVVVIYIDEPSHKALEQPFTEPWNRAVHARLLDRLAADGAKAVVLDILFTDPGPSPETDRILEKAIRDNGKVILAADFSRSKPVAHAEAGTAVFGQLALPHKPFLQAAAGWGFAQIKPDQDFLVREHFHGEPSQELKSLTWAAAEMLGLPVAAEPRARYQERWVRYYGGPVSLPQISFAHALQGAPPGFFRDKIVLVGARPMAGPAGERKDEFRNPFASGADWTSQFMPSVEIHATCLLNLLRDDWLRRAAPAADLAAVALIAVLFGAGLFRLRPFPATLAAGGGVLLCLAGAYYLFIAQNTWFPWLIIAAVQIPCALTASLVYRTLEWYAQKRLFQHQGRLAEKQIREQASLLEKASDGIIVATLSGRITYWNAGATRLYGWSFAEAAAADKRGLPFQMETPEYLEARRNILEAREWSGELAQSTRSGAPLIVASRWTLLEQPDGGEPSILQINSDITEKKQLEAQLFRTQRLESIGTLAGGIAHDLNNVLTPILIGVDVLRKRGDGTIRPVLKTIEASAQRGAELVKQVLTFSRGHEGERSHLQLRTLVNEMEGIIRETFPKSITVNVSAEKALWSVFADATQVHQVLLNLCVNARDAMPEGGDIEICAENVSVSDDEAKQIPGGRSGSFVRLSVTDTGTGIPQAVLDRMFEPFFTTKEQGKGTGLGLATVLGIMKNHGGMIAVNTELGKGTEFASYWPRVEAPSEASATGAVLDLPRGNGEMILIAEDEEAIRNTLKSTLIDHGYKVMTAVHGGEAVSLFMRHRTEIALVLADMMMPVMDGSATIRTLRKLDPALPIVAMSGLLEARQLHEGLKMNDLAFLAKPFAVRKLLWILHKALAVRNSGKANGQEAASGQAPALAGHSSNNWPPA